MSCFGCFKELLQLEQTLKAPYLRNKRLAFVVFNVCIKFWLFVTEC